MDVPPPDQPPDGFMPNEGDLIRIFNHGTMSFTCTVVHVVGPFATVTAPGSDEPVKFWLWPGPDFNWEPVAGGA